MREILNCLLLVGDIHMLEALNPSWPERIIMMNSNATMSETKKELLSEKNL